MTRRATVFVCVSCRRKLGEAVAEGEEPFDLPGVPLADSVRRLLEDDTSIAVETVECLAVCKRPCTVALVGDGKWTYVIGDLDSVAHPADVAAAARAFADSENGIVPWKERPQTFRKGVISRIPPIGFSIKEAAE
jgi:predicted metal-binding protein